MDYIIYFAITIGILVFVHEFGHFIAAKFCGMRADVFAIGFGKRLLGWNKKSGFSFGDLPKDFDGEGHTDYRLSLLPLGGYVKIAGMVDESFDTDFADKEPQPYEFRAKPTWQKIIVITAGVFMNLLLTIAVFWSINFFHGKEFTKTTTIGFVEPHTTADSLGFKANDNILTINGKNVSNWEQVITNLYINAIGQNLQFKVERNGRDITLSVPRSKIPSVDNGNLFLIPSGVKPVIGEVLPKTPAQKAGIKSGDVLLSLNSQVLYSADQTKKIISSHKGVTLPLLVLRDKDTVKLDVTPGSDGLIGVQLGDAFPGPVVYETYGFFQSLYYGGQDVIKVTDATFKMADNVIRGKIAFGKAFGLKLFS